MAAAVCFVCATSLAGFDETASQFHVNQCLDGLGSGQNSGQPGGTHSETTSVSSSSCPVCGRLVQDGSLEDHVEACLVQASYEDATAQGSTGRSAPGAYVIDPHTCDACPCCLLDWSAIDVPASERDLHVAGCLAQQQSLADEETDSEEEITVPEDEALRAIDASLTKRNGFGRLRATLTGQKPSNAHTTEGLIPQLQSLLEKSFTSGTTHQAVLCTPHAVHVKSQFGDFGWGCGYKSAMMVFSAARHLDQYCELLQGQSSAPATAQTAESCTSSGKRKLSEEQPDSEVAAIPTIAEMQALAEEAWQAGFDPAGKRHFNGKLVGSRKWIGTSEVYVMFTWMGMRVTVIDFPKSSEHGSTHRALTHWVFDYFKASLERISHSNDAFGALMSSKGSAIRVCDDRMPLYLQHQGHSRTIVGVEQTKSGELNLLVFDCGKKVPVQLKEAVVTNSNKKARSPTVGKAPSQQGPGPGKLLEPFRVNLKDLSKRDEYQILCVETTGGPLSVTEKLARRKIASVRVT